jgi:hypothetical protein
MTSITERLSRNEWNPVPGDTLLGVITAVTERCVMTKEGHEFWFPVIVVRREDDSGDDEWIVDCGRGGLTESVIAARPKAGQRIGFKFIGPMPRSDNSGTWDRYVVEFEDESATEPDWDRMAASRARRVSGPAATPGEPPD